MDYEINGTSVDFSGCTDEFQRQGKWGESYVKNYLEQLGRIVVENPNKYGSWDLISINKDTGKSQTIQVKTTQRYIKNNYFNIKLGKTYQTLVNLLMADRLIIIAADPAKFRDDAYGGNVLDVINHRNYTIDTSTDTYIIPSEKSNFKIITSLSEMERAQLNSFDTSKYS